MQNYISSRCLTTMIPSLSNIMVRKNAAKQIHVRIEILLKQGLGGGEFYRECEKIHLFKYDLKKYYDTCILEYPYDGYVADVFLCSKVHPNRSPIFIEIAVTHHCGVAKTHSGIRIIEITLPRDTDDFSSLKIIKENKLSSYNEQNGNQNYRFDISFYNFKSEIISQKALGIKHIPVFFINKNGKGQILNNYRKCTQINTRIINPINGFEVHFREDYKNIYEVGVALANLNDVFLKNCFVCKFQWHSNFYNKQMCKKNKEMNGPSDALKCDCFVYSKQKALQIVAEYKGEYDVVKDNVLFYKE